MEFEHKSVMLFETVDSLDIKPDGTYIDCTAGGGGHSREIAKKLDTGRLICIDRDPEAIEVLNNRLGSYPQVSIVKGNFFDIKEIISSLSLSGADGILADLGVSSHQLDCGERGFSFHRDAPLDMRMSKEGISAADIVNTYEESSIKDILYKYGEEKFAPLIARAIVKAREVSPVETTLALAEIVKSAYPAKARRLSGHPARKTFQALRIAVNGEIDRLGQAVEDMFDVLNPDGRLSIITFHSLEDRLVKKSFSAFCQGCVCPAEFPVCVCGKKPRGKLAFKFKKASEEELEENPRSRSATLRCVEKLSKY